MLRVCRGSAQARRMPTAGLNGGLNAILGRGEGEWAGDATHKLAGRTETHILAGTAKPLVSVTQIFVSLWGSGVTDGT